MWTNKIKEVLSSLPTEVVERYHLNADFKWRAPEFDNKSVASIIDHTYLKTNATKETIVKICNEAKENGFYSVCVQPCYVDLASAELKEASVKLAVVSNFPLGTCNLKTQKAEIESLLEKADEIDFVSPYSLIKNRDYRAYFHNLLEIRSINPNAILKIILETSELSEEEKIASAIMSFTAGFNFLKTSTGFASGGATPEDVALLREVVGDKASVKASGGIRSFEDAKKMILAGANRLGCSSGLAIVNNKSATGAY